MAPLYDEPFLAAVPSNHPGRAAFGLGGRAQSENMLLLGTGHCFRDHVLEVCPEFARLPAMPGAFERPLRARRSRPSNTWWPQAWCDTGAAPGRARKDPRQARRRKSDEPHIRYLPIQERDGSAPPMRRVVLAGGAVLRATKPLLRCATPSMPASCRGSRVFPERNAMHGGGRPHGAARPCVTVEWSRLDARSCTL